MDWADFYRTRDPERYLQYAKRRYEPFLAIIRAFIRPGDVVLEAGCGMGTITRALIEGGAPAKQFIMVDRCPEMLGMAAHSTRHCAEDKVRLYDCSIFDVSVDKRIGGRADVVFSHGVLEHYGDHDINAAILEQEYLHPRALVHYVPGERYSAPSFGDERLMPAWKWQEICEPCAIVPFNEGFDYALVWSLRA
jgi:trans-aconitate methyltransferase